MHTIHLIEVEDGNDLLRVRAVQAALRALYPGGRPGGGDWTARDADEAITEARDKGAYLLGEAHDLNGLVDVAAALEENGCIALIDHDTKLSAVPDDPSSPPSPEEVFANAPDAEPEPQDDATGAAVEDSTAPTERPLFSQQAYETAMALLVMQNGKPAEAAAHARTLGRTTEDDDLYLEAINALLYVFPWIRVPLEANHIVVFDD